jgi:hypothetical protein
VCRTRQLQIIPNKLMWPTFALFLFNNFVCSAAMSCKHVTQRRVLQPDCATHVYGFCMSRCFFESLSNTRRLCGCRTLPPRSCPHRAWKLWQGYRLVRDETITAPVCSRPQVGQGQGRKLHQHLRACCPRSWRHMELLGSLQAHIAPTDLCGLASRRTLPV